MPVVTIDKFDAGLDLRKGPGVSDANRLIQLENAYVNTGMAIQKRPGLLKSIDLTPGTKGLFSAFGKLHTFYSVGNISHSNSMYAANKVAWAPGSNVQIDRVAFVDVFLGFIYASITYSGAQTYHHYLNGRADTRVLDTNCPNTDIVLKASSKLFSPVSGNRDALKMSAGANALDWTSVNDAASLGVGLYSSGSREVRGLGLYKNELVVFMRDGIQSWNIDPDPRKFSLKTVVENVGTNFPRTISNSGTDLYFLSDNGFRSLTTTQYTNNLSDFDIGSPIDKLVRPQAKFLKQGSRGDLAAKSVYFYATGQYICAMWNQAFVYSTSKVSQVAAWSRYTFNDVIDDMAEFDQELYIRCRDIVYKLSDTRYMDNTIFNVVIQLPYLNFKKPGSLKRLYGLDVVIEGTGLVSVGWNANDPTAFTPEVEVSGNTRPGDLIPVECTGTEFSVRIRNVDDKNFRLDAISLYWDDLGVI